MWPIQLASLLFTVCKMFLCSLIPCSRGQLKCDGTRAETGFRLSAKWTSPFKSVVASVQSTTGGRGVRISGSSAGYTMFRGSVNGSGYPLHSSVSPSHPIPCATVCHPRLHFSHDRSDWSPPPFYSTALQNSQGISRLFPKCPSFNT